MSSTCYFIYRSTFSTVQSPRLLNFPSSSGLLPILPEFRVSFSSRLHYSPWGLRSFQFPSKKLDSFEARASAAESEQPKWWEKTGGPNMVDIHSTQDFLGALSQAGDRLVIAEFYGTWCASCRALFPKLCKTAEENPDILFLKVNFDENKSLCKSLNVKVLPYFHFYRGADGLLESFSCSLAKYQKIKDAIATHKPSSFDAISLKEKTSDTSPR